MPVIKAEQPVAQSVSSFSMTDIEQQARAIIIAAKVRAERLIHAAQQDAEELKREAHAKALVAGKAEGLAKGLEEGRKQGRDEALAEQRAALTALVQALTTAVTDVEAARVALDFEARTAVIELAIAIAQRVTKRYGAFDAGVAVANVEEALRLVVHTADVRIAVHPSQQETLAEVLPRIQAKWPNLKHVELLADGTLAPGGCRVFSAGGQIDADLDLQLSQIAQELVPQPDDAVS